MNYLCVAVKKEVITEIFYSRDEALAYFQQRHGNRIVEKMEESERRLENQITILGRKLEKYKDQPEMRLRLLLRGRGPAFRPATSPGPGHISCR